MQIYPDTETRLTIARALLEADCLTLHADEPFRLPSGWSSPLYMDCRRLLSFPKLMRLILERGLALLREHAALEGLDSIVGAEASGIALASWFARELDIPMQFVRKKSRGLGQTNQIVGVAPSGSKVLLIDDLMAAGYSMLNFCRALQAAQLKAHHAFVVFDYATYPTEKLLEPLDVRVYALANWHDVLTVMQESNRYSAATISELKDFLADPVAWSHRHQGYPRPV